MNEGDIRVRGLEAIREWMSKDDRYMSMMSVRLFEMQLLFLEEELLEKERKKEKKVKKG